MELLDDSFDPDMCINIDDSDGNDNGMYYQTSYVYEFDDVCIHGIKQSWPMNKYGKYKWDENIFIVSLLDHKGVIFCPECFISKVKQMFESLTDRERKMLFKRLKIWHQPDKFYLETMSKDDRDYRLDVGIAEIRSGLIWEWEAYFRDCHAICCEYGLQCIGCYFCYIEDSFGTKGALDS
jgi:hypothetical protein